MPSDHEHGVGRFIPSAACTVLGSEARTASQTAGRGGSMDSNNRRSVLRRGGSITVLIRRCRKTSENKKAQAMHNASNCVAFNINGTVPSGFTG